MSPNLSGRQYRQSWRALCTAFTQKELERMFEFGLNKRLDLALILRDRRRGREGSWA